MPPRLDDLVTLPGVGRKTANVVLGNAFGIPGITVDTHFGRLARRFGWTDETDPVKVEHAVGALFRASGLDDAVPPPDLPRPPHLPRQASPPAAPARSRALCPSYGDGRDRPRARRAKLLKYELAPDALTASDRPGAERDPPTRLAARAGSTALGAIPAVVPQAVPPPPEGGRRSAVLILFGPVGEAAPAGDGPSGDVLLTERAHDLRSHAGQVAFPGGGVDPGDAGPGRRGAARGPRGGRASTRPASRSSAELPDALPAAAATSS